MVVVPATVHLVFDQQVLPSLYSTDRTVTLFTYNKSLDYKLLVRIPSFYYLHKGSDIAWDEYQMVKQFSPEDKPGCIALYNDSNYDAAINALAKLSYISEALGAHSR